MSRRWVALVLVLAAMIAAPPARAQDIGKLLRKGAGLPEVRRLADLHDELDLLIETYLALEADAGRARLTAVEAGRAVQAAQAAVDAARLRLDDRVRTVYELGPGAPIEALLGAPTFADLALISEYASRTITMDEAVLHETLVAEAILIARRTRSRAAQDALDPALARLRSMLVTMQAKVDEATRLARRAYVEEEARKAFEAQQRLVAAAVARAGSWDLGVIDYGADQSHLLALLGPDGGRTCETPPGLVETGQSFDGYASWYGWEFGGQPTATGAIFDPGLFTAANRWLPFGTFLRVRHGDRCALVLINDRGPYGRLERVIDLSQAAADHLGVGVSWVRAEILLPAEALPAS